jgi:hypothetical protein
MDKMILSGRLLPKHLENVSQTGVLAVSSDSLVLLHRQPWLHTQAGNGFQMTETLIITKVVQQ